MIKNNNDLSSLGETEKIRKRKEDNKLKYFSQEELHYNNKVGI